MDIMAVITFESEVTSSTPPARLFKAFILDGDDLVPKVMPQAIKNVETLKGDGGAGTIKLITFSEGDAPKNVIEKVTHVVKIKVSGDGRSICKTSRACHSKGDVQLTEEQTEGGKEKIKAGKEKALVMFKAVEAYLLANPHEYN